MEVNEEKRNKFIEYAGKRVNNVMHDIQILEPMARSNSYDFTKEDVEEMFNAMQETLNDAKTEFEKKFEEKSRTEKKVFSFGASSTTKEEDANTGFSYSNENIGNIGNIENSKSSENIENDASDENIEF